MGHAARFRYNLGLASNIEQVRLVCDRFGRSFRAPRLRLRIRPAICLRTAVWQSTRYAQASEEVAQLLSLRLHCMLVEEPAFHDHLLLRP